MTALRRAGAIAAFAAAAALAWIGLEVVRLEFTEPRIEFVHVATWGDSGSGVGQFVGPVGVAVDDSGYVYVSDSGNDRIQKFAPGGRFVSAWDPHPGRPGRPMHLAAAGDRVYVPDYLQDRVWVFTTSGEAAAEVGPAEGDPGAFDAPAGVAVRGKAGTTLAVADFYHHRVSLFDSAGSFTGAVGEAGRVFRGRLHYPTDATWLPDDRLAIADAYNHRVQVHDLQSGSWTAWGGPFGLGVPASGKGWFRVALAVAADSVGTIYVADFGNDRVQAFAPDGAWRGALGRSGNGPGEFRQPIDVAVGPGGRLYVADFGNDRVQVFDVRPARSPR